VTPPLRLASGEAERLLVEHATRSRLVHIYVDSVAPVQAPPVSPESGHASTVAASLRELLRERGFDVRATEVALPRGEVGVAPGTLAKAVAAGEQLPQVSRAVTYLHPNAPRLVLFARLDEAAITGTAAPISTVLGAFIADSADGTILWSGRVATTQPITDLQLRQLAAQLLKDLPNLPPV
jgi:hypothetical protein